MGSENGLEGILSGERLRLRKTRKPRWLIRMQSRFEWTVATIGGYRFYQSRYLSAGGFLVRHEHVEVEALPPGLHGYRIAHLSDIHAGAFVRAGDLRHIVASINELEVDTIALTGDYVTHHSRDIHRLAPDLAALESRSGCIAVLGNHDYYGQGQEEVVGLFESLGIDVLRNRGARIDTGQGALHFSGLEDLAEGHRVDPRAARSTMQADDVEVFLCHNPAKMHRIAEIGCPLVLCGHTHGGQVSIAPLPRPGPQHPGERLEFGATTTIINRGVGAVGIPFRFRAPAEVVIVTLVEKGTILGDSPPNGASG